MEIIGEDYTVSYDTDTITVTFIGSLRLQGIAEYGPINDLLTAIIEQKQGTITLNLAELKFLNSSGINILSRFVINIRKQGESQLIIRGSNQYPWQGKSLKNLQRLMPGLQLILE
jgi:hypothetical protein